MEIEKAVRKPALGMEKIKKLRVAGRSREGNRENEPVRLKLLIGVAAPGDGAEIAEICNANAAALSYAFEGWGTARSAMLDYLGLDESPKQVVLSLIPETAEKALAQFGVSARGYGELNKFGLLADGTKVSAAEAHLFERRAYKDVEAAYEAMHAAAAPAKEAKAEAKPAAAKKHEPEYPAEISIDDFAKVKMQIAEVIACEKVEKSDKLLKSTVKVGDETRTVVSGIAKFYTPEEMVGKKVVMITNLKPAKLRGILSEGMLLCAEDEAGNLSLLTPEKAMPSGSGIF